MTFGMVINQKKNAYETKNQTKATTPYTEGQGKEKEKEMDDRVQLTRGATMFTE